MVQFVGNVNQSREGRSARQILEDKIQLGRASAAALIERINTMAPRDSIAKGSALRFGTRAVPEVLGRQATHEQAPELVIGYGDQGARIHRHALGQLASRAGVPSAYLAEMANGFEWQRRLAAGILNEHFHQGEGNTRFLLRNVGTPAGGEVRGFLSDKFRRLDNRPLVDAFATECAKVGAVPVDGTYSDTRVSLKALVPQVYEPVPGEVIAFGVEWGNSDFGSSAHVLRAFMLRVWCLNGATMENALSQVHLGRGISDDIELSQRTYELDTRASISALRDVVVATLAPRKIEAMCAGIQHAHEEKIDWKSARTGLAKKLLKGELAAVEAAFESEDTYNLPAGQSVWRMSNALSWVAGQKDIDSDRKLDLQRLAGQMVNGVADRAMAAA